MSYLHIKRGQLTTVIQHCLDVPSLDVPLLMWELDHF